MQKLHFAILFCKLTCLSFLGDNLENIWYTTILAFGREYAYSLAGIECCQPVSATVNWNDSIHLEITAKICLCTRKQCHYREVPRWGVSNRARHNWNCFLAYKKFEVFLQNFICFWYIKMCHIYQKHFWGTWWFHRSKDFEAMKAEKSAIRPKSSPNLNSCSINISHRGTSL